MATMALAAPLVATPPQPQTGLRLDTATHVYTFNGRRVVGVTSALQRAGILDYSGIPQHVLDNAAERGRAVHLALDYFDRGTLNRDSLDPQLEPYLQAYEHFCADSGFVSGLAERSRYHAVRQYAGTFDRSGVLGDDAVVLDFKSGAFQEGHFCQLALYGHFNPMPRRFRYIGLQLSRHAKYRVHEMPTSKFDYYSTLGFSAILAAQYLLLQGRF